ncbi:MAG: hypothetical protein NW217_11020 [Hyphomicrobiaceae bacterium]|nr:hypothetical protein [Hyphomicrobiaceae bacterium]
MSLSPALMGALVGLLAGVCGFITLRLLAGRIETSKDAADPAGTARVLRIAAFVDLIIFPIAGYVIAPMVVGR